MTESNTGHTAECRYYETGNKKDCNCKIKPASSSPATNGKTTPIIEPETRVENSEVVGQSFEQPNQNLMLLEETEGLLSQVNDKLYKLANDIPFSSKITGLRDKALEEIDLLQKTTIHDLRKAFE